MFDTLDYNRASDRLNAPVSYVMAMAAVEASGETLWIIDNVIVVPIRFEAHWFGKLTEYEFNNSNPDLSCTQWNPGLAANTRAGAWDQLKRARMLNVDAANQATSWGGFQVMGFHWQRLYYPSVQAFVDSMLINGDDGQMDAFCAFVEADSNLHSAFRRGDWNTVELLYNGGGYNGAYAAKLAAKVALYSGPVFAPAPRPLRKGMYGPDVATLQTALGIAADGVFGNQTDTTVRNFQTIHGLVVDGVAGQMTLAELGLNK